MALRLSLVLILVFVFTLGVSFEIFSAIQPGQFDLEYQEGTYDIQGSQVDVFLLLNKISEMSAVEIFVYGDVPDRMNVNVRDSNVFQAVQKILKESNFALVHHGSQLPRNTPLVLFGEDNDDHRQGQRVRGTKASRAVVRQEYDLQEAKSSTDTDPGYSSGSGPIRSASKMTTSSDSIGHGQKSFSSEDIADSDVASGYHRNSQTSRSKGIISEPSPTLTSSDSKSFNNHGSFHFSNEDFQSQDDVRDKQSGSHDDTNSDQVHNDKSDNTGYDILYEGMTEARKELKEKKIQQLEEIISNYEMMIHKGNYNAQSMIPKYEKMLREVQENYW